jgi:hypothetical protein
VGDAARQLAEALEALRLAQLGLEAVPLRDVVDGHEADAAPAELHDVGLDLHVDR